MLTFSSSQMKALDEASATRFAQALQLELEAEYPEAFGSQPAFVRRQMVANGLVSAARYGIDWQSALSAFVSLQCGFSPDFHTHPKVRPLLESSSAQDERLRAVISLPEAVWEQIEQYGSELAWFDPPTPAQRTARVAYRTCSALPSITQTWPETQVLALFQHAPVAAARHGIDGEVGISVFAAALAAYGPRLDAWDGPAWAHKVFSGHPPAAVLALLRYRLSLDFGVLI